MELVALASRDGRNGAVQTRDRADDTWAQGKQGYWVVVAASIIAACDGISCQADPYELAAGPIRAGSEAALMGSRMRLVCVAPGVAPGGAPESWHSRREGGGALGGGCLAGGSFCRDLRPIRGSWCRDQ